MKAKEWIDTAKAQRDDSDGSGSGTGTGVVVVSKCFSGCPTRLIVSGFGSGKGAYSDDAGVGYGCGDGRGSIGADDGSGDGYGCGSGRGRKR